jgi:hypothetical protein
MACGCGESTAFAAFTAFHRVSCKNCHAILECGGDDMTPVEIIEQVTVDGVILALFTADTITATGDQSAVDKWLPTIRDNKPSILCELHRECRRIRVLAELEAEPSTRYAVHVADASTDPVIATVGIRDVTTFPSW